VRGITIASVSTIVRLDFRIVQSHNKREKKATILFEQF